MKLARYQSRQAAIATEAPTEASPMPMGWRFRALCLLCAVRPGAVAPDYRRLFEKGSTGLDEGVGPGCLATRMGVGDRGDRARGNLRAILGRGSPDEERLSKCEITRNN